jgi:hypothetical protein
MKVSIIGGGGLVGSSAAFALQCGGIVRELAILDANAEAASGQALDLLHGGPSTADQIISSGGYEHIPSSDIICITAGLRRKPDESRLDLINRNTDLFVSILDQCISAGVKKDAIVVCIRNFDSRERHVSEWRHAGAVVTTGRIHNCSDFRRIGQVAPTKRRRKDDQCTVSELACSQAGAHYIVRCIVVRARPQLHQSFSNIDGVSVDECCRRAGVAQRERTVVTHSNQPLEAFWHLPQSGRDDLRPVFLGQVTHL